MTPRETVEVWSALIAVIGTQVTLLVVAAIHAWASANRGRENREQNREILAEVSEIKGAFPPGTFPTTRTRPRDEP
jgi:hypothetical protein